MVTGPKWPESIHVKKVERYDRYVRIIATTNTTNEPIDQMIPETDLADVRVETVPTDFSSEAWKIFLALETKRYRFASLYDPLLAMNASKVDPLPHQIEAVYGHVLRMPRIRFLLAHDPGAGKTIMAGLIIKELKMRRVVERVLIVVPGHLKDQWSRELKDRFSETFTVISRDYMKSLYAENAWMKENQIITSMDFAKQEEVLPSLSNTEFDMIVVDEAHKMSASVYGEKTEKTERYRLGEILSKNSEHLLFLTATPHRGDPENFRLFLDLLSPGFFKTTAMIKESLSSQDNPLFLRRIKEDMEDFEGNPLFVPRKVKTPEITLSDPEKELYNDVSIYVKEQYDKALKSDKKRHIGFALLILQRRMASSTHALLRSLERRRCRLEKMLEESSESNQSKVYSEEELVDMSEEERWKEEEIWETLSVAENRHELENEIVALGKMTVQAQKIINGENESKLSQLKDTLKKMCSINAEDKILIFTESKDTLEYIERKVSDWGYTVNTIHGNMQLEERVKAEAVFKHETQIMVATEAAGEGINLQFCHLMINYDLPWNPNRLEQRMGRIHRYGQQREVYVFNMVASDTREGQVMIRMFEKLEEIKHAMSSDKVFDVISEILPGKSLTQLLVDAAANARDQDDIIRELDSKVDEEHMASIKDKLGDSLATRYIDYTRIKEMRTKAVENKLIPKYTEELFKKAFLRAGGKYHTRKDGFIAVDSVPYEIRRIANRDDFKKRFGILVRAYSKATFDKEVSFKHPDADFVTFGHPLFESTLYWIEKSFSHEMQRGATFLDPNGMDGYIVFQEGEVRDGTNQIAGKQLFAHFVDAESNEIRSVQPNIIWDFEESHGTDSAADISRIKGVVLGHVMRSLEEYNKRLQKERDRQAEIKRKYGVESLSQSIKSMDNDLGDLKNRRAAGENVDVVIRNKEDKKRRYAENKRDLEENIRKEQSLTMSTPVFVGIIRVRPPASGNGRGMRNDPSVEDAGMRAVMEFERNAGRKPEDVSQKNLGFDVRSVDENGDVRYIEVKARAAEGTVALTTNEWYQASQMGDSYYLYVVWNAKMGDKPIVVKNPAANLKADSRVVQYFVNPEEIRKKGR